MSVRYKRRISTIEELSEITRRERRIVMVKKIRQNIEIRTHKIIVMQTIQAYRTYDSFGKIDYRIVIKMNQTRVEGSINCRINE